MSYLYIFITIFLTVYGQCVIKWQVMKAGTLPDAFIAKISFMWQLLLNVWIISGLMAAFLASLTWMAAMTKLPLGHAYPFVSLSFVLVVLLSSILFNESITPLKIAGLAFIMFGVLIGSRG